MIGHMCVVGVLSSMKRGRREARDAEMKRWVNADVYDARRATLPKIRAGLLGCCHWEHVVWNYCSGSDPIRYVSNEYYYEQDSLLLVIPLVYCAGMFENRIMALFFVMSSSS